MVQQHLTYKEMTDYGCFYTPQKFVGIIHSMLDKHITDLHEYTLIDTSSGYGSFLNGGGNKFKGLIANDMDIEAVETARAENGADIIYYNLNALQNVERRMFGIKKDDRIIVVGNPPYNDTTSFVKGRVKNEKPCEIDSDIKTRDLGISFLLSYNKLKADYVAVLHPLSYMIKKANYKLAKPFYDNYKITDCVIISSREFLMTSRGTGFPICVILYKRDDKGTAYSEIIQRKWQTIDGKVFDFNKDTIANYIKKYPNKSKIPSAGDILFWTMRDINALKRNRTFITEICENAVVVDRDKLPYYCYVDIFKEYANQIPYYLGNYDVFIDNNEFQAIKDEFVRACLVKYPFLRDKLNLEELLLPNKNAINLYFNKLLGVNYVY